MPRRPSDAVEEYFVSSNDGTRLHVAHAGVGERIVLVHGTMGSKADWFGVTPGLAAEYEVVAFDRRGRGASGDAPDYSIDREVEDVLAIVDRTGPPVHLIGHSFGAVVVLLAAARAVDKISRVVLYEPPVGDPPPAGREGLRDLEAAVQADDLDAAVAIFASMANITASELNSHRANARIWSGLRDAIPTAAREIRAAAAVLPIDERTPEAITVPTLVLVGSEQHDPAYNGLQRLAEQLPLGSLARVPGHHLALVFEPDAFTNTVRSFLGRP